MTIVEARDIIRMAENQGLSTGALQAEVGIRENANSHDKSLELGAMRFALIVLRDAKHTLK